jgi:hypothetical protein
MQIVAALRRIRESSANLETLCNKKASPSKIRGALRNLSREFEAVLTEVHAAYQKQDPALWYKAAMQFLRELLAIRYDKEYYRDKACSDFAIIHACALEWGQLFASSRVDSLLELVGENTLSVGKALGPAVDKTLASSCEHVFEDEPPRTKALMVIEDGAVIGAEAPNVVTLSNFRKAR